MSLVRTTLLNENLISRRMTRQGDVYAFRKPAGPPPNEELDRWLHRVVQVYDFTPLFNGDQQQARYVAQGFLKHLKDAAKREGRDWKAVVNRLRRVSPFMRRSLYAFFAYYDGLLRSGG